MIVEKRKYLKLIKTSNNRELSFSIEFNTINNHNKHLRKCVADEHSIRRVNKKLFIVYASSINATAFKKFEFIVSMFKYQVSITFFYILNIEFDIALARRQRQEFFFFSFFS